MNFDTLIKDMEKELGFQSLHANENGAITFESNNVLVSVTHDDEHVFLITNLCLIPEDSLALYTFALHKNNYGTLDAHLGVLAAENSLILTSKIRFRGLSKHYFFERFNKHFDTAENLMQEITNL